MIPFLTEVLELAAAVLLLAGAMPLFKKHFMVGNILLTSGEVTR
ncbi:hypothetical protein [Roseobacter sp. MH60115]|nr:hypothetical protein [Roseobacter sp. MH60115]